MKKYDLIAAVAMAILIVPMFASIHSVGAVQPPITTGTFWEGNIAWGPYDADPAICYDTGSGELIVNSYQGLLSFKGEQYYDFTPTLATNVPTLQEITTTFTNTTVVLADPTDSHWHDGGNLTDYTLVGWRDEKNNGFDAGDVIYVTDGTTWTTWTVDSMTTGATVTLHLWRGSYVFYIRTTPTIYFYNSTGDAVDTFDVYDAAYSFQWGEVIDPQGYPYWMFDKPLFDAPDHTVFDNNSAMILAHLIQDAIVPDTLAVPPTLTFNIGCHFPDNAFKQILSSTWGSIQSKERAVSLGGWDGNLFTTTKYGGPQPDWWIDWAGEGVGIDFATLDPLDQMTENSYAGTGPYHVSLVDEVNNKVILQKNPGYWQGWPAPGSNSSLDTIEIDYIADWPTRKAAFLAGDIDTCAVPIANMFELLDNTTKEPAYPQIETIKNIVPLLSTTLVMFQFRLSNASYYIGTGHFPDGIPLDFFNNTHVRRAFAYSFNWSTFGQQAYYGESDYRTNPLITGLYPDYYNADIPTYYESLLNAEAELKQAVFNGVSVWDSGFTFAFGFFFAAGYDPGSEPRRIAVTLIKDFFGALSTYNGRTGPPFTVVPEAGFFGLHPPSFLSHRLPMAIVGWLADFADADDFIRPFMHGGVAYAYSQGYSAANGWGVAKDALVDQAVLTPDGPARAALYQQLQQIYYSDCPSFPLPTPLSRRWCQYWVKGWYYDAAYPSTYYYTVWKADDCWYDSSGHDARGPGTGGISDGVCNMKDIAYLIAHFNARAPIPGLATDPKWNGVYGANGGVDSYGDRVSNMKDIAGAIQHFNHRMNTFTP